MIINPARGQVEEAKVFDTYNSSAEFDKFIENDIPDGYILVAACKDDCTKRLSQGAKAWFQKMGSK